MKRFLFPSVLGLAVSLGGHVVYGWEEPGPLLGTLPDVIQVDDEAALLPEPAAASETETIRERYADGKVKIERQVTQDLEGNYFNHGSWAQWDATGRLLGGGEYRNNLRNGRWVRYFEAGEAQLLSGNHAKQFQAPFASEGTFVNGKLHGTWRIVDAQNQEVLAWQYENGERHGKSVWFFPNGQKRLEVDYVHGGIDGLYQEWSPDSTLLMKETYADGHRTGTKTELHPSKAKKSEGNYLFAKDIVELKEDWWTGASELVSKGKEGKDLRHGTWTVWHTNGQKAMEGQYDHDQPTGKFTWWHANGQKSLQGEYAGGMQSGRWVWWHENGQKQIQGEFAQGAQSGSWTWWNDAGKVAESAKFSEKDSKETAVAHKSEPMQIATPMPLKVQTGTKPTLPEPTLAPPKPIERTATAPSTSRRQ